GRDARGGAAAPAACLARQLAHAARRRPEFHAADRRPEGDPAARGRSRRRLVGRGGLRPCARAGRQTRRMTYIVDAHHHIWRQADMPWLSGPIQPRIFGPYEPIRRDYPIQEYLGDLAGSGVTRSVYVQTNWANDRFEDETAWVQQTARDHGWPHAI